MPSEALSPLRVLLLDGDTRQAIPVAKALRAAGHHVAVAVSQRVSMGGWSRYPHERLRVPALPSHGPSDIRAKAERAWLDAVLAHLRQQRFDVTIPLFDTSAALVSRHLDAFAALTRVPLVGWDRFVHAHDKHLTMQACARAGVPHPRTLCPHERGVESVIAEADAVLGWPCLWKPDIGHGAAGIRKVASPQEALALYPALVAEFGPCALQEFVPQTGMQFKAQLFRGRDRAIHGAVVFDKVRYYPVSGGTSSLNTTVDRPDIVETCRRLLDAIDWESHADIDLIEDPRDGSVKVMEINPRVTGSIKIAFEAGVDFADLLVRHALGEPLPACGGYRVGVQMRYMPLDVLWFLSSPGRLRAEPSFFRFVGRDLCYQEGSLDDPLPALAAWASGAEKWLDPAFRRRKLGATPR